MTVWFTGLPCAGKTTLASALRDRLEASGVRAELLDGDELRSTITAGLGFSKEDRNENVRRVGWLAELLSRHGVVAICALVSPYRQARDDVSARHHGRFVEVHVATPLEVCAARDVKGLYAAQQRGDLSGLSGVDDPYEPPLDPEVVVGTDGRSVDEVIVDLLDYLHAL
jgi:adenylylsulfate kinase